MEADRSDRQRVRQRCFRKFTSWHDWSLWCGYGKSAIYQARRGTSTEGTAIAVVSSPLIALMKEVKMLRLERMELEQYIGDIKEDAIERVQVQQRKCLLVSSGPETLLGPFGRSLLTIHPPPMNTSQTFLLTKVIVQQNGE
ncbi:uncharacterized protein [Asterias amurensis]|uniref:uncharacterized protein n=1 Tax=Asterias amurensis TaxID=7602 RepID=UPI003AB35088